MKTSRFYLLLATFLLVPYFTSALFSQQEGDKKIVITKRTLDADGTEVSETIVKKGAAADKFDVEKYIAENRADNTQVEVKISSEDDEHTISVKGAKSTRSSEATKEKKTSRGKNQGYQGYEGYEGYQGFQGSTSMNAGKDPAAFLGVEQDSDERADQPGLVVDVIRGAAADRAGLRHNDKIMKINDTPINNWSDLTKFVNNSKVGDKVRISYQRNGKSAIAESTLTSREEVKSDAKKEPKGVLGVSDMEKPEDSSEPGVAVRITRGSAAENAGLQNGDIIYQLGDTPIADFEDISDYMAYTKPGEKLSIIYEHKGKRSTVEATLTEPNNDLNLRRIGEWDPSQFLPNKLLDKVNNTVNVRKKDACLGVYSDAFVQDNVTGSRINDFTEESAAREVNMAKGDIITAVEGQGVKDHDDLWTVIARHKVGDKVMVEYLREGKAQTAEVTLRACRDNSSRVQILDEAGEQVRNFTSWNWNKEDQRQLSERSIITIRRGEGDAPKMNAVLNGQPEAQDRSLSLNDFKASPNPSQGLVRVEFTAAPVATIVSFFDLSGRQLFREELNAFNGQYNQQFDVSEYATNTITIHIQQADKIFTEQLIVN